MGQHSAGDLHLCPRCFGGQVGRCRLEKEEGFFRDRVVEFLDVVEVVATDGDDLERVYERERGGGGDGLAFLPCLRNWTAAMREAREKGRES